MTLIINKKTYEAGELIAYVEKLEKENTELKEANMKLFNKISKLNNGDLTDRCRELESTNKQISAECHKLVDSLEKLQKENTELQKEIRCECTRCVYSDSPCIRSDYGVENDEDVCPNYENVFTAYTQLKKENAELKKTVEHYRKEREFLLVRWKND